jgi:hypothetical protein
LAGTVLNLPLEHLFSQEAGCTKLTSLLGGSFRVSGTWLQFESPTSVHSLHCSATLEKSSVAGLEQTAILLQPGSRKVCNVIEIRVSVPIQVGPKLQVANIIITGVLGLGQSQDLCA